MDEARKEARRLDPERTRAKMRERSKRWADKNKERDRARRKATLKKWKRANREAQNAYERSYRATRIANDPSFKLRVRLSSRLYAVLRSAGLRKHESTVRLLGCTPQEAKVHIERQFNKGMTWSNWGDVWHVDHIRPLAGFDLTNQEQRTEACHFTNLRPLPKAENMSKGGKALYLL